MDCLFLLITLITLHNKELYSELLKFSEYYFSIPGYNAINWKRFLYDKHPVNKWTQYIINKHNCKGKALMCNLKLTCQVLLYDILYDFFVVLKIFE